jgi:sec-independent protein translocase protein TatA
MGTFSIWHLLLVAVVGMLLFGAGRVSEMGKGLGEGIRNFKKGLKDEDEEPVRPARSKTGDEDEDVEVQIVKVPKKLLPAEAAPRKKKVIQVEVDEDADEAEIARTVAAKKKALASEDEKAT